MLHFHSPVLSMCLFFDAKNAYKGRKRQQISILLPNACQMHQLPVRLPLRRYLDSDHHAVSAIHLRRLALLDALHCVQTQSCSGHPIRILWSPEWAVLTRTANLAPPTPAECCAECHAKKQQFRDPSFRGSALRDQRAFQTQCRGAGCRPVETTVCQTCLCHRCTVYSRRALHPAL